MSELSWSPLHASGLLVCLAGVALLSCARPVPPALAAAPDAPVIQAAAPLATVDSSPPSESEVVVRLSSGEATAVEMLCSGGYRERMTLGSDAAGASVARFARFEDVSPGECTLYFKGGPPAAYGVLGRCDAVTCDLIGTTAVCSDLGLARGAEQVGLVAERGVLQVQVVEAGGAHAVELTCDGKRHWVPIKAGLARAEGLPSEGCRMVFQGVEGEVERTGGGRVLTCRVSSAGAACTEIARFDPVSQAPGVVAPDAPVVPADAVWVEIPEPTEVQAVELVCPGGHRDRKEPDAQRQARFESVGSEACTLHLKGPVTGRFGPVQPGSALVCSFIGTILTCTDLAARP